MNRIQHIAIFLRMLVVREIRAARQSKSLLNQQSNNIEQGYKESGTSGAEAALKEGVNHWRRLLIGNYTETVKAFSDYTFQQLSAQKADFLISVQQFIATQALLRSTLIHQTTVNLMRGAIQKGNAEGLGEAQIAKQLRDTVGGTIATARARTIARTETHNAATYAMQAAAEDTHQDLMREWVSIHDERTRDTHAAVDGEQRGMDESFDVNGEMLNRPGEGSPENAINCRCTLIYVPNRISTN